MDRRTQAEVVGERDLDNMVRQGRIELAGAQLDELGIDVRVGIAEALRDLGQVERRQGREHSDGQPSAHVAWVNRRHGVVEVGKDSSRADTELLPRGRQHESLGPAADEQRRPNPAFEIRDQRRDRRLSHVQRSGGLGHARQLRAAHEVDELRERDVTKLGHAPRAPRIHCMYATSI